jgi:HEAT repeat protein
MSRRLVLALAALAAPFGAARADDKLVEELVAILKDTTKPTAVRASAVSSLGQLGPEARDAVPALIVILNDASERSRAREANYFATVAKTLGQIGPDARSAVPALVKAKGLTTNLDGGTVDSAIDNAIRDILNPTDPKPKSVAALTRQLRDKDESVRLMAAKALGKHGESARSAVPALTEATRDSDADVRRVAAESLGRVRQALGQGEDDVTRLAQELKDKDEAVRLRAAKALGRMGPSAAAAASALSEATKDPDEDVRRVAKAALDKVQGK